MNAGLFWIVAGICIGVAAGILGAYVSWRRSRGTYTRRLAATVAVATLIMAGSATAAVLKVTSSWEHRATLLLAPGFLAYWFVSQVREMCGERGTETKTSGREV